MEEDDVAEFVMQVVQNVQVPWVNKPFCSGVVWRMGHQMFVQSQSPVYLVGHCFFHKDPHTFGEGDWKL